MGVSEVELIFAGSPMLWSFTLEGGVIILIRPQQPETRFFSCKKSKKERRVLYWSLSDQESITL